MYALYEISVTNNEKRYRFQKRVSLFGSKSGYIPWLLSHQLDPVSAEPKKWHVEISGALSKADHQRQTLIINLKPNSTTPNLSLYELLDVWGYSDSGWTPIDVPPIKRSTSRVSFPVKRPGRTQHEAETIHRRRDHRDSERV